MIIVVHTRSFCIRSKEFPKHRPVECKCRSWVIKYQILQWRQHILRALWLASKVPSIAEPDTATKIYHTPWLKSQVSRIYFLLLVLLYKLSRLKSIHVSIISNLRRLSIGYITKLFWLTMLKYILMHFY